MDPEPLRNPQEVILDMATRPLQRLSVGEQAPDFRLPATGHTAGRDQRRCKISLAEYRGKKNVVLVFFPAAFTPI